MRLIRYIGVNLRRTLGSSTFWYCVLAAFADLKALDASNDYHAQLILD